MITAVMTESTLRAPFAIMVSFLIVGYIILILI